MLFKSSPSSVANLSLSLQQLTFRKRNIRKTGTWLPLKVPVTRLEKSERYHCRDRPTWYFGTKNNGGGNWCWNCES